LPRRPPIASLSRAALLLPALLLPALALAVLLPACPGDSIQFETGAADCSDGQDNDGDGKIDCQDGDCYPMAFCMPPPDGGLDVDRPDLPVTKRDKGVVLDGTSPKPDLKPPPSSYGKRCNYTSGSPKPCADGKTVCVPSSYSSGFCTHQCSSKGAYCPAGPTGTKAYCGYNVSTGGSWLWYCIFLCSSNQCPNDTKCYYSGGGQFCF
jgi:hypothetical protein